MYKQRPNNLTATILRLAFAAGGIMILLALLFGIPPANSATANSSDRNNALSKYPFINGTRIDTCSLCHTSSIPSLNPYGSAYLSNGRNVNAFGTIENMDSDGDGFKNVQEITALFFPGDPNDHPPAATSTPTQVASPTPTRTASPSPTPTSTPVIPTSTQTNTPVPPTPTSTNTSIPPTSTQTNTSMPPSPTSTNTPVPPTPAWTNTPVPVTPTQTSTSLPPPPTSTNTPVLPTPTLASTSVVPTATQVNTPVSSTATPANTLAPTPISTNTSPSPTATSTNRSPTSTPTLLPPKPTEPSPTPSETPIPPVMPSNLDLDILSVSITSRVPLGSEKLVIIRVKLVKRNNGERNGVIEISGTENGTEIYHATKVVDLEEKGESLWFSLPSYMPTQIGRIHWKIQVIDNNPDPDTRGATTSVTKPRERNRDGD